MSLNVQQQSVVNELSKNILLLASAGTGKTDTLSRRIVNIVSSEKALPSEILCITFTNKACKEMRERIESLLGKDVKGITVKTFHSFCFDIIKENAKKKTDIFADFTVFDEEDCKNIISRLIVGGQGADTLRGFIEYVKHERAKRNFYSGDVLTDYENTVTTIFLNSRKRICELCTKKGSIDYKLVDNLKANGAKYIFKYDSILADNHGMDFSDLIVNTYELFKDNSVVEALKKRYKYINIDEVQDTSSLEYEIIEKIFADNNVLICGDIFQTIYSWRGSDPKLIFSEFEKKYDPVRVVFNKNYRATKNLTNASLDYLRNAFPEESQDLYKEGIVAESNEDGEKIHIRECENVLAEAHFIFDEMNKLQREGVDISKSCVLTRDNGYNVSLSTQLKHIMEREAVNFEFVLVDQYRFFRRQEIKDVIAFLKLAANRYDSLSLKRITKRLPTGIGDRTLDAIGYAEYRKIGISLSDYIDPLVVEGGEKYSLLINEFNKDNIIVFDVESTGVDVTEDEIIQIAAIKLDHNGNIIDSFEKFLKNKKSVASSEHVHGFSDEYLMEHGEDTGKVLLEFKEFTKNAVVVGHNVQYDINIFTSQLARLNLGKPEFRAFYDTLDIYRRFHPNTRNHKLETLSNLFATNHKPSHDAMDDIIATGELMVRAINEDIIPTSFSRIGYMTRHLKAFTPLRNKLNKFFDSVDELRPCDIVAKIVNDFALKTLYAEDEKNPLMDTEGTSGSEKISRLRDFYVLVKDLDDKTKSNRDALLDIIKITGLSNGDLENLIVTRTKKPRIPIITVHQAKGLEYDTVFLSGIQNNVFPSYRATMSKDLTEEKRTFYVAITRAKKRMFITYSKRDRFNRYSPKSVFLNYMSEENIDGEE